MFHQQIHRKIHFIPCVCWAPVKSKYWVTACDDNIGWFTPVFFSLVHGRSDDAEPNKIHPEELTWTIFSTDCASFLSLISETLFSSQRQRLTTRVLTFKQSTVEYLTMEQTSISLPVALSTEPKYTHTHTHTDACSTHTQTHSNTYRVNFLFRFSFASFSHSLIVVARVFSPHIPFIGESIHTRATC